MCMQSRYIPHMCFLFLRPNRNKTYHKCSVDAFDSRYELGADVQIILIKLLEGFVLDYL
jgi:hypothetical protein